MRASALLVLSVGISFGTIYLLNGKEASAQYAGHAAVSDQQSGSSVPGRLQTYRTAWALFKEHPLIGGGIASFGPRTVASPEQLAEFGYGIVNNIYLEVLAETGALGLLCFLGFLLSLLAEAVRRQRDLAQEQRLLMTCLILGLLAVFVQYNFFSTLYIIYIWVFLAYLRGMVLER